MFDYEQMAHREGDSIRSDNVTLKTSGLTRRDRETFLSWTNNVLRF